MEQELVKNREAKKTAHSIDELNEMRADKSMPVSGTHKNLDFGLALYLLNDGYLLQRAGWNGKGMFIYKTVGNTVSKDFIPKFASLPEKVKEYLEYRGKDVVFNPSLTMLTATGEMQPGWLASQTDILATDWQVVKPIKK